MNQETSTNTDIQDQLKDLRELTVILISQLKLKPQNEALLETRSQVKEQAETLRSTNVKLATQEVMSSIMEKKIC